MKFGKLLLASAAVFAMSALATIANAATVSIAFQQAGVNMGNLTTVATGTDFATFSGNYGTFTSSGNVSGSSAAIGGFGDLLGSTALSVTSSAAGTLTIYVTAQGLTSPPGNVTFISDFTSSRMPAGWSVTEETRISTTNQQYAGALLATHTFTGLGVSESSDSRVISGPYSLTTIYTIVATGAGRTLSTIGISAVPGPMVGAGLPGLLAAAAGLLALARRRRKVAI